MPGARRARAWGALAVAWLALAGCASHARRPSPASDAGAAIATLAVSLVGAPYHFGGADAAGFDCSGLAFYVHERVGLTIPRTAREQQRAARAVPLERLAPGDLVFFHIHARRVDHVGIYAGAGRFIHAPRPGSAVAYGDVSEAFYRARLVSAGRFWDAAPAAGAPR
ncbi:MAG TPA: C40 family peptidase [Steroidobacteraceae bacterium]|nr:C40 family peptidase [Steroidobacteraceae bacterium]